MDSRIDVLRRPMENEMIWYLALFNRRALVQSVRNPGIRSSVVIVMVVIKKARAK